MYTLQGTVVDGVLVMQPTDENGNPWEGHVVIEKPGQNNQGIHIRAGGDGRITLSLFAQNAQYPARCIVHDWNGDILAVIQSPEGSLEDNPQRLFLYGTLSADEQYKAQLFAECKSQLGI